MLKRNDELIEQFNKEEQTRQRLERRRRARRKRSPELSEKNHKILDRLEKIIERRKPTDCIARKWVG